GNYDALAALLKRFERTHGDTVLEVRAALGAGQRQPADQALHRLRGVAGNLGANEVARLTAHVETALREHRPEAALQAALDQLAAALDTVCAGARSLNVDDQVIPTSNTAQSELPLKLAELQGLLQNNNLKALEHFRALRPALAELDHAAALADAVESLNFDAAGRLVEAMMQRKDSA
ncbi:MAG: Hpt domain-containing protein, partial [Duganella sp.]